MRIRKIHTTGILLPLGFAAVLMCVVLGSMLAQMGYVHSPHTLPSALAGDEETEPELTMLAPPQTEILPEIVFEDISIEAQPVEIAAPATRPASQFPLEPLCFAGEPHYAYSDERLAVHIQRVQQENLAYFVCDIQTTDPSALKTALSGDKAYGALENTADIAARNHAVLAINGDNYAVYKNGVIIRGGNAIRSKSSSRHMLMLDSAGNLTVHSARDKEDGDALEASLLAKGVTETWEFGPELIRNGQAVPLEESFNLISTRDNTLEPRTAIGQINPLHYVVIVVDGRRDDYSQGISLKGLQQLFLAAGAQTAFNLDGGGSSTLYFNGEVLNRPSGGHERSVSDILFFK